MINHEILRMPTCWRKFIRQPSPALATSNPTAFAAWKPKVKPQPCMTADCNRTCQDGPKTWLSLLENLWTKIGISTNQRQAYQQQPGVPGYPLKNCTKREKLPPATWCSSAPGLNPSASGFMVRGLGWCSLQLRTRSSKPKHALTQDTRACIFWCLPKTKLDYRRGGPLPSLPRYSVSSPAVINLQKISRSIRWWTMRRWPIFVGFNVFPIRWRHPIIKKYIS